MRDTTCPQPGQIALYRFYDADDGLLYVGFSNEPWRRRKEHSVTQPWYPRVRHQAITWYGSEREARDAETRAIKSEHPEFNVAGAVAPVRAWLTVHPLLFANIAGGWLAGLYSISYVSLFMPSVARALVPCLIVAVLGAPVVTLIALVIVAAPLIRRFGAWIERNSVYPVPRGR